MRELPLFLAGVFVLAALAMPGIARAEHCPNVFFSTNGDFAFLDHYERAEYQNGLLALHFRNLIPFVPNGPRFRTALTFWDDECGIASTEHFNRLNVTVSTSTKAWSVRFSSPTHYDIWNDETNMKETCSDCTVDVFRFPSYTDVSVQGFQSGFESFGSGEYKIQENGAAPPLRTETLPTPSGCQPFSTNDGYFFDSYERGGYENGLLTYHFRFKSPYDNGRAWSSFVGFYDDTCRLIVSVPLRFLLGSVMNTPFARYWSLRFSSPTHFDIWNDETNTRETCAGCSVDLGLLSPYLHGASFAFFSITGDIDGGASRFTATPFHIADVPPKPDPVIIVPGLLGSAEKNGVWVIDPIFHVYDDLIATLAANGYTEGADLFTLPYDWRESNLKTALLLRDKIAEVKNICRCAKVDLVAHSMGGLAARQYIQSADYAHDVDQLIFLGTPHLGAPKAYLTWEAGESSKDAADKIIKFFLTTEAKKAGYSNLYNYIHNKPLPSFQELLPIRDYLHDKATTTLKIYPTDYPSNSFLENLNNNVSALLNSGVKMTDIVGDTGTSTITAIRVVPSTTLPLWQDGFPDGFNNFFGDKGLEMGRGDETVPLPSAKFIDSDLNVVDVAHTKLPTKAESLIYKKLTIKDPQTLIEKSQILKILGIKILSPADIMVVAPDGKRVGKDFATGTEVNEIDGAFYSGFQTDDEYITIPNPLDGEYRVEVQGTGSGEYTLASGFISDTADAENNFTAVTAPGVVTPIDIALDNAHPDILSVRPVDVTPPRITVTSPQAKDYAHSEFLPIDVTITDDESGVFASSTTLNGKPIGNGQVVDLFFARLGDQSFVASSTNFVGNATSTEVKFRVVATSESTVSDIERAYSLGWISEKGIKNSLLKKLEEATKVEKKGKKVEKKLDKILGKAFLNELKAQLGNHVNMQAYSLLLEDINWLIINK